jgi:hypothetical protein
MEHSTLNSLIRKIHEFESNSNTRRFSFEKAKKKLFEIISPLFIEAGYKLDFYKESMSNEIDFIAYGVNNSREIGLKYQHNRINQVEERLVNHLAMSGIFCNMDHMVLISNAEFSLSGIESANKSPILLELLDINSLKTWISRIEVENNIGKVEVEEIIKIVSKRFIELIAKDPENLEKIEWRDLERIVAELFEGIGFFVKLTPPSKDGGKDIILNCTNNFTKNSYIVEIKHWRSATKVGQDSVKDFLKVICSERRNSGLFLSTYGFTKNAFEGFCEIERKKIKFGSKEKIISLCKRYLKIRSGIWEPINDLQEVLYEDTL